MRRVRLFDLEHLSRFSTITDEEIDGGGLLQFYKGSRDVYHKCEIFFSFLHQYSDNK